MTRRARRPVEAKLAEKLSFYQIERQIASGSEAWASIAGFQRKGLVRLRWDDTRKYCNVSLTEAGHAAVPIAERLPNVF